VSARAEFQPEAVIRLLGRHEVRWVLIGGLAAITHGAPLVTQDVDICYARDGDNLRCLAAALGEARAELRGADPGLRFRIDAKTLQAGDAFTFTTDVGWLDLLGTPSGTSGFEDLARTADAFDLFGYRVLVASSGEEALRVLDRHDGPIDLLVTDVVMPGMSGRQLAEAVARRRPGLRALFLSGYTPDEVLKEGVRAEEAYFLQKPFTPSALLAKVREVLTRSGHGSRQLIRPRAGI